MRLLAMTLVLFCGFDLAHAAPNWPPASEYLTTAECADGPNYQACTYARFRWSKVYATAIAGKYYGQRDIAYCLSTGCDGAIKKDVIMGCAWRTVIIRSRHVELDRSDLANFRYFCGPDFLDDSGRRAALAQTGRLFDMLGVFRKV